MQYLLIPIVWLGLTAAAVGGESPSKSLVGSVPWQSLNIGGGGRLTNMTVTSDNYLITRADVFGAYLLDANGFPNSQWRLLTTSNSMASYLASGSNNGSPAVFAFNGQSSGVQEVAAAPSNPKHLYMFFQRGAWYSLDRGQTWVQSVPTTGFPICNCDTSNVNPIKNYGQKIAVDPNNENVAYLGTGSTGMYVTLDGGATWTKVGGGFPPSTKAFTGIYAIVFDKTGVNGLVAPTTGCPGSSCRTNTIYATPAGSPPYVSMDGGATWSVLPIVGAPSDQVTYGKVTSDGTMIFADDPGTGGGGKVWNYTGGRSGTWSTSIATPAPSGSGVRAFAIDPFTSGESTRIVAVGSQGELNVSIDKGRTWSGWSTPPRADTYQYPDFPWIAAAAQQFIGNHSLEFDQKTQNRLWMCASGDCFYLDNVPSTSKRTTFVWTGHGYGIQELVSIDVLLPPGSPYVFSTAWDKWLFQTPVRNNGSTTFVPTTWPTTNLATGWNLDYASTATSYVYAPIIGQGAQGPPPDIIAWTPDYGTHWFVLGKPGHDAPDQCGGLPTSVPPERLRSGGRPYNSQGIIAASTPCNFIYAGAQRQPWYTTDGGHNWNVVSIFSASGHLVADNAYAVVGAGWSRGATSIDLTGSGVECSTQIVAGEAVLTPDVSNGTKATVAKPPCTGNSVNFTAGITQEGKPGQHLFFSNWCCVPTATVGQGQQAGNYKGVVADRVTANTFYLYWGGFQTSTVGHPEYGVYRSKDSGATWRKISNVAFNSANRGLVAVPTQPGNVWDYGHVEYTNGNYASPGAHPKNQFMFFLKDNGADCSTTCQSWAKLPLFKEASALCFGKPLASGSYPAIYAFGYASTDGGRTYTYGLWRSATFDPNNPNATTWTKLDAGYPNGAPMITTCSASMDRYGEIYVTTDNYNWAWGVFP